MQGLRAHSTLHDKYAVKADTAVTKKLDALLAQAKRQTQLLAQIAHAMQDKEPNYRRPLRQFKIFDWTSIGAVVMDRDEYGPTILEWGGHQWLRRTADSAKFGTAVWYSRHAGGSGDNASYYTLIKFTQKYGVEAMDTVVAGKLADMPEPTRQAPSQSPPAPQDDTAVPSSAPGEHWKAEALTCDDALMFDTAYQKYRPDYYKSVALVSAARDHICGDWQPGQAAATLSALDAYANAVKAGSDKLAAVAKAQAAFREKLAND